MSCRGVVRVRWIVRGGGPLAGTVRVGPAKNALLPALAAALLTVEPVLLEPASRMRDVRAMADLLAALGADVSWTDVPLGIRVRAAGPLSPEAPDEAVASMRASVLVLGPLLVRCGRARISDPGGCAIGTRPIDLHLLAMRALGAEVVEQGNHVAVSAPHGLRGGRIVLPYPSHTATENAMLAACGARGDTVIVGAASEPEIVDLAALLQAMGAEISGAGGPAIRIRGCAVLRGTRHRPMGDRIEAGTLLLAGAVAGGTVTVAGVRPGDLEALQERLRAAGCEVGVGPNAIAVRRTSELRAVDIRTQPHPGFPTDLQPQFSVLATCSVGQTLIEETVFDRRLEHLRALAAMGARVQRYGTRLALIDGPARLTGRTLRAADLRGGAALVLAGLVAGGETAVDGTEQIERGYADLPAQLRQLGAGVGVVEPAASSQRETHAYLP